MRPRFERSLRPRRQRGASRGQQKTVDPFLAVALRAVAVCVIIGHQRAFHYGSQRVRIGRIEYPGQFPSPARTQMPDGSPNQVAAQRRVELLVLTRADHQQLRRRQARRPAQHREFKGFAGEFARCLQLPQLIARFRRQTIHRTDGAKIIFETKCH